MGESRHWQRGFQEGNQGSNGVTPRTSRKEVELERDGSERGKRPGQTRRSLKLRSLEGQNLIHSRQEPSQAIRLEDNSSPS